VTARRARRHLLPGAALVGLGLLLVVPRAQADPSDWAGSHMTTPSSTDSPGFTIAAEWHHDGKLKSVDMWVSSPASSSSGCPSPSEVQLHPNVSPAGGSITYSSADVPAPCNGTYSFRALATATVFLRPDDTFPLSGSIDVAVPPDNVRDADATVSDAGDSIAVTWSPDANPAPDFLGYRVQRKDSSGSYTTIATLTANETHYTDTSAPAAGKEVSYRVLGRRSGPNGHEVTSTGGGTTTVTVPEATTTTVPGDGTSTSVPGATTGGPPGTAGGTTAGATGGGAKTITKNGPLDKGKTGIGVPAPSLGTSGPADFPVLSDGGEEDPGFDQKIDYGTGDGLAEEGSSGGDGLSSAFYEQGSGRGMAIPVATGFVLAAWAFHLRFLARAARPARVTPRRSRF
jgi:hypothetical protein